MLLQMDGFMWFVIFNIRVLRACGGLGGFCGMGGEGARERWIVILYDLYIENLHRF